MTSIATLSERFPHLQREIRLMAEMDSDFRQLSDDYALLVQSLIASGGSSEGDIEELYSLKTSLEAEALEKLSQASAKP